MFAIKSLLSITMTFVSLWGFAQIKLQAPKQNFSFPPAPVDSNLITVKDDFNYETRPVVERSSDDKTTPLPVWIIDSVKMNSAVYINYIDPNDILNLDVITNKSYPGGAIILTLKDHKLLLKLLSTPLLSLSDITNTYLSDQEKKKPLIYLLNDKLLTDTTGVRIPLACLQKVSIVAQTPYFKPALLVNISTTPLSIKPKKTEIMIRGLAVNE